MKECSSNHLLVAASPKILLRPNGADDNLLVIFGEPYPQDATIVTSVHASTTDFPAFHAEISDRYFIEKPVAGFQVQLFECWFCAVRFSFAAHRKKRTHIIHAFVDARSGITVKFATYFCGSEK